MKLIIVACFILLGFERSMATENEGSPTAPEECDRAYSCLNCTAVRVCRKNRAGKLVEVRRANCSSSFPYCDTKSGTCQRDFDDVSCTPVNQTILCMADGYYPHPTNYRGYYICNNGSAHTFTCSSCYDVQSQRCSRTTNCGSAVPFDCGAKHCIKVAHRSDPSYYAYCAENVPVFVDSCPNGYEFNETMQTCTPICTEIQIYADLDDSSMYYVCGRSANNQLVKELLHRSCTDDYIFDPYALKCTNKPRNRTLELTNYQTEEMIKDLRTVNHF